MTFWQRINMAFAQPTAWQPMPEPEPEQLEPAPLTQQEYEELQRAIDAEAADGYRQTAAVTPAADTGISFLGAPISRDTVMMGGLLVAGLGLAYVIAGAGGGGRK